MANAKRPTDDAGEGPSQTKKPKTTTIPAKGKFKTKVKASKEMTDGERKKRVALSAQKNPLNVFVIGPHNNNWEDNSKKLAGYLNFTGSLEAVRQFLNGQEGSQESRDVHTWIEKYLAVRRSNYRRPEASLAKGNQVLTVNVKQLFETLDDASAHIIRLFDPNVDLPLASDGSLSQGTMRYAIATSIKAMTSLISLSPTMFPASHAPLEQRTHPMGPPRYPAEDWHRAHQLLRFAFRQRSDAKAKANFFTNDQSNKGDAEEALFFTLAELEGSSGHQGELDVAEGDDENRVVGALIHEAQRLVAMPSTTEDLVADAPAPATAPSLDADPRFWADRLKQFEDSVENADKEMRSGNTLGSHGVFVRRSRLDKANMRKLCIALGSECNIIHDDATIMAESGQLATDASGGVGISDAAQVR
jgi:hypothetical protein